MHLLHVITPLLKGVLIYVFWRSTGLYIYYCCLIAFLESYTHLFAFKEPLTLKPNPYESKP